MTIGPSPPPRDLFPITSFDSNLQEIGRRSARLLLDIIRGNPRHGTMLIGCSLVVRQSTVAR